MGGRPLVHITYEDVQSYYCTIGILSTSHYKDSEIYLRMYGSKDCVPSALLSRKINNAEFVAPKLRGDDSATISKIHGDKPRQISTMRIDK